MGDAELIDRLIEATVRADDWRKGAVRPGFLPLFNHMGPVFYLTSAGDVVRNDDEDGPLRPAQPDEREFGLIRAAELYPELAHLRQPRPPSASTCRQCRGQGRLSVSPGKVAPWSEQAESQHFVYCPHCNSRGWTTTPAD